jgi:hypothetical protein
VQARDFVEQWDKAVPGEGATAIRAILSLLSDPAQQRAFLGGDLPKGMPFGVLRPDPAEMIDHVMAPERQTRWVYDLETGNAGWVVPKTLQLLSSNEATDQAQADKTGRDADEIDHGLLAPFLDRREPQVGAGVQVAQNGGTISDAISENGSDQQLAQVSPKSENTQRELFKGGDTTPEYRDKIIAKETVGIAKPLEAYKRTKEGIEVLGRYQLNRHALVDAGFKNADGTWKAGNALGIKSDEEFLRGSNAAAAQDAAFEKVSQQNEKHIRDSKLDQRLGTKINGIKAEIEVSETGLAAAVHRGGVGNVQKYFERMEEHGWDSNKAVATLSGDAKDLHLAIETRLREFSNVKYRT